MEININITNDDAISIYRFMDELILKEVNNQIIPRNHVLLLCILIKDSILKTAKQQNG